MQKACKIKIKKENPGVVLFAYSYGNIGYWQEVNISKRGKTIIMTELSQLYPHFWQLKYKI
jgi:hypothetical protein